jgi:hypothetical protein
MFHDARRAAPAWRSRGGSAGRDAPAPSRGGPRVAGTSCARTPDSRRRPGSARTASRSSSVSALACTNHAVSTPRVRNHPDTVTSRGGRTRRRSVGLSPRKRRARLRPLIGHVAGRVFRDTPPSRGPAGAQAGCAPRSDADPLAWPALQCARDDAARRAARTAAPGSVARGRPPVWWVYPWPAVLQSGVRKTSYTKLDVRVGHPLPGRVAVPRAALSTDTSDSSAQLHRAKVRSAGAGLGA